MNVIAVIPARLGSTRFGNKVLAKKTGKFLVQHTYEQAKLAKIPADVIIAADDEKVAQAAALFGATCVMTSPDHTSGTDRIAQVVENVPADIIINIQADEPEIDPENIDILAKTLIDNPDYPMATLMADFKSIEDVSNPNIVKIITDLNGRAIYFSRLPIPYDRDRKGLGELCEYKRHLGVYAYRKDFLLKITKMPQSRLEKLEKLEQLRALENGFGILAKKIIHTCDGIDTARQYEEFVARFMKSNKQ